MKDLAKTYAPIVALAVGAFIYWSVAQVAVLKDTLVALQEQNEQIVLGLTGNCETLVDQQGKMIVDKPAEVSESAGSPDTLK